ncbi:MAG: N-acetylmuramoyl-L-alanine amidase [Lachnospiraceae bacterium]|nr:N-acetylmuramoyl-L-alanine amidase [Lachnospiraceae bacterium]
MKNGASYKTYSHPDMSPKLSGGTNAEGAIMSTAISDGMVFDDGTPESEINLKVAEYLRDALLDFGYNVLMIREDENSRLDNIARTILANNHSDIHVSIHFDSTDSDKGMFVILPIEDEAYLSMEPVKSNYKKINELGDTFIEAFRENGEKVWNDGKMLMDLTQISYSTIPSVDLELGDKATDTSEWKLKTFVPCIVYGIEKYYHNNNSISKR